MGFAQKKEKKSRAEARPLQIRLAQPFEAQGKQAAPLQVKLRRRSVWQQA
jgi:hypothetical protein